MGRICPILNHPLKDGVLIEDEALVKYINKRNLDFLPNELVCRWCKTELIKLYNKKIKKAKALRDTHLNEGSISSLKSTKSSSAATISKNILSQKEHANAAETHAGNGNKSLQEKTKSSLQKSNQKSGEDLSKQVPVILNVSETSIVVSTSPRGITLAENRNKQATPLHIFGNQYNVTKRKKTIKDYLSSIGTMTKAAPQVAGTLPAADNDSDSVERRLSQEPTTSKVPNGKRRLLTIVHDSDDESLSINAVNGTVLPNVQPIPPKRKARLTDSRSLAKDIMDDYIKTITGG